MVSLPPDPSSMVTKYAEMCHDILYQAFPAHPIRPTGAVILKFIPPWSGSEVDSFGAHPPQPCQIVLHPMAPGIWPNRLHSPELYTIKRDRCRHPAATLESLRYKHGEPVLRDGFSFQTSSIIPHTLSIITRQALTAS